MNKNLKIASLAAISFCLISFSGCTSLDFIKSVFGCNGCSQTSCSSNRNENKGLSDEENPLITSQDDGSDVLVKFVDGTMITEKTFANKFDAMLSGMLPMGMSFDQITVEQKRMLVEDILKAHLIEVDYGPKVKSSKDFDKLLRDRLIAAKQEIVIGKFVEELKADVKVSDAEISQEYNSSRDRFIKNPGGTTVFGAKFEVAQKADDFMASLKEEKVSQVQDFEKMAKRTEGAVAKNFGRVSSRVSRGLPEEAIDFASSNNKYPSIKVFNVSENENWVLMFVDFVEAEYYSFDEVKERVSNGLEQKKFESLLNDKIELMRKKHVASFNEAYFQSQ